ncbi:ImmA/IrrE family metallo-endopeptidase, partial [Staphylococcus pseudintermedius]
VSELAEHLGFTLRFVPDLPHSTRSVTDLKHGRIHISGSRSSDHDRRTVVLQALAAAVLGHGEPRDYEDFLAQRVAVNYLAGALLMPQRAASSLLRAAQKRRDLSVEDLNEAFGVSYEAPAAPYTNL